MCLIKEYQQIVQSDQQYTDRNFDVDNIKIMSK